MRRRLMRQAALPNTRVSGKQEQSAGPGRDVVESGQQLAQLAIPADQCRCCPPPILHPAPTTAC